MLTQIHAANFACERTRSILFVFALAAFLLAATPSRTFAQTPQDSTQSGNISSPPRDARQSASAPESDDAVPTLFPHSNSSPFWISGQLNFIDQGHRSFTSPYQGPHSLLPVPENAFSRVFTLCTGWQTSHSTELLLDLESAGGAGISNAFGLAGYSNLDVVRNPELGPSPYIARGMFHAVFALGSERQEAQRNPLSLFTSLPARRLEFRVGRFQLADFFDTNSAGNDSHLQFLNWTVDNSGGYDYAADTRGYTVGALLDFEDQSWGLRFAETLMPRVANGIAFQWNLQRARAENFELELRPNLFPKHSTIFRLLAYMNHANMGDYRTAIQQFENHQTAVPEVTNHPLQETIKYGFGANAEQGVTSWLTTFARFGWDEGRHESFVYTEVNQTISLGLVAHGSHWRRKFDRAGLAFTSNAISGDHRRYLQLGGIGFLLGDGNLSYGREKIIEGFYTAHLWRGAFLSVDLQHVNNPGYNQVRGPVLIPGVRLHLEL